MTEAVMTNRFDLESAAPTALNASARTWWVVTAVGQWLFAFYVLAVFGPMLLQDGIEGLKKAHLFNGFIPGDTVGNYAVAGHIMLAVVIMGAGPLQLIPQIRARYPVCHHWSGRSYILAAVVSSIAGLYLIWTRPIFGQLVNNVSTSFSGVLVIVFAAIALRHAMARDIRTHRRWALRLFMVASSVWFLRVGTRLWVFLTGGVGIYSGSFTGPFVVAAHLGQFLLPLAVLEVYLRARDGDNARSKLATATGLLALTILMGIGIFLVATGSWFQRI